MEWYLYLLLIAVGFIAGFINVLAGSGSTLTLPLLIFMGLPANVANGTNRIAILLQNLVAVRNFKKQEVLKTKSTWGIAIPTIIGSLIGALLAVELNNELMNIIIAILLIIMFFIILLKPSAWIKGQAGQLEAKPSISQIVIFFFIGIYGGFIQAGVGFFLLAGLVLGAGLDLLKANAIKVFIVFLYTPIALAVFIYSDQINYEMGLILAIGNMGGAYIASKYAKNMGTNFIRWFLLIVLFFSSLKLLGLIF